jgi:hypothetical protein
MNSGSRFVDAYAKVLTWMALLFGVLCGVGSVLALITVLVMPGWSPWMYLLVLVSAGICVATFVAKPLTGADLSRMSQDSVGKTRTSSLRQQSTREGSGDGV